MSRFLGFDRNVLKGTHLNKHANIGLRIAVYTSSVGWSSGVLGLDGSINGRLL